jgi:hypothetical protein
VESGVESGAFSASIEPSESVLPVEGDSEGDSEGDEESSPELRAEEESVVSADEVPEDSGAERDGFAWERAVPFDESALLPVEPPDPVVSA